MIKNNLLILKVLDDIDDRYRDVQFDVYNEFENNSNQDKGYLYIFTFIYTYYCFTLIYIFKRKKNSLLHSQFLYNLN